MPVLKYWDAATSSWKNGDVGLPSGQVWSQVIGDGVAQAFTVTHGFGTRNVMVSVCRNSPPYDEVEVDVEHTDANSITIRTWPSTPGVSEYIVNVASAGTQATLDITMDTWHKVGDPGEPAFLNNWSNYTSGGAWGPARYRKYPDGRVRVSGAIKGGAGSAGQQAFRLPVGYRPPYDMTLDGVLGNAFGTMLIQASDGGIYINTPAGTTWTMLDGIEFDTESVLQTASVAAQPIENWHTVGDPGEPQYLNNWASQDGIRQLPSFRKMPDGTVRLKGTARSTVNQSGQTVIFVLPAGYRPTRETWFMCAGSAGGGISNRIEIGSNGNVNCAATALASQNISLDNISFMVEDTPVGAYATGAIIYGPQRVTSLPANPADGQECYYVADATNGVVWHLKYNTSSGSAYKWEYVGGAPLYAEILTAANEAISSATYVALTTPGPNVSLPLAGDYDVEISFMGYHLANGGGVLMSYDIGATAAVDADAAAFVVSTGSGDWVRTTKTRRKTGLGAVTLASKWRVLTGSGNVAGTSGMPGSTRYMRVTPVRVG